MSSAHAGLNHFQVSNNELLIDGQPISRIAARLAPGPFYAYSRELITARVKTLRSQLPKTVEIHYAMKANPMPAVVHHFAGLVDGIDVASIAEAQVALHTGLAAQHISFAGPGKQAADIQRAVAAGIILNCESVREVKLALAASQALGLQAQLALRINPDFELKGSGMKMGGGAKQFGMDVAFVPEAIAAIKAGQAHFVGFHCYAGSQNLKAEALIDAQNKSVALALRLALAADTAPDLFNIGGGFGIPYFPGESALELAPVCDALSREAESLAQQLPNTRIALELGRYLVGEAGVYCCRVVERKSRKGKFF
jgi:diaminopimelate decarboxylase